MPLITKADWARKHGFSRSYVSKLIRHGKIDVLENGMLDEFVANAMLRGSKDPDQPIRRNGERRDDIYELLAKTRLKNEIEKGRLLEAKVKSEIGKLLPIDSVRNAMFAKGRLIRDSLLNIPNRIASVLADETDAGKIHDILLDEIRIVLKELSGDEKL